LQSRNDDKEGCFERGGDGGDVAHRVPRGNGKLVDFDTGEKSIIDFLHGGGERNLVS